MTENTERAVEQLTGMLEDQDVEREVQAARLVDPVDELRRTIFGFFEDRLRVISEKEDMKRQVEQAILDKVAEGGLEISDLLSIYRAVYDKTNDAVDALLAVFRPGKDGSTTPLLEDRTPRGGADGNVGDIFENASREDLERVERVYRMIQSALQKENQKGESESS